MKTIIKTGILIMLFLSTAVNAAEPGTDLRVLIDVSGSMKKNDPQNFRIPALRLLIGLLPADSLAGIWLFEKNTQALIKHQTTNSDWKNKARNLARGIHSRGQFTDIETAINKILENWPRDDTKHTRHLILLSDGMIDINGNAQVAEQSRSRIINKLLPALKHNRIRVHTVALSKNADHKLLQLLSRETNGWYEQINSSQQLNRTFLKLFENTTQTDKVPLKNNQFNIDSSISDMTILVFRDTNSPLTKLITPQQKTWTHKNKPDTVKWYQSDNYELITISTPAHGKWQLQAKTDPDNRVMVVTNLKLKISPLSKHLLAGDQINLHAWLEQENEHLNNTRLLKLVKFSIHNTRHQDKHDAKPNKEHTATHHDKHAAKPHSDHGATHHDKHPAKPHNDHGATHHDRHSAKPHNDHAVKQETDQLGPKFTLEDNGENGDLKSQDGIYQVNLSALAKKGTYTLKIAAKSPTFERLLVKNIKIHADPIRVRIVELPGTSQSIIQALATPGLFLEDSLTLTIRFSDNQQHTVKKNQMGLYEYSVPTSYNGQTLTLDILGQRTNRSLIKTRMQFVLPSYKKNQMAEITRQLPISKPEKKAAAAESHLPKKKVPEEAQTKTAKHHKATEHHQPAETKAHKTEIEPVTKNKRIIASVNWALIITAVVLGNALIIGLGLFFNKRKKRKTAEFEDELDLEGGD